MKQKSKVDHFDLVTPFFDLIIVFVEKVLVKFAEMIPGVFDSLFGGSAKLKAISYDDLSRKLKGRSLSYVLGYSVTRNREVNCSEILGPKHISAIGGSRSGKSNLLNILVRFIVSLGQSLIYFDPKTDNRQIELFYYLSKIFNVQLNVFSPRDTKGRKININPLRHGDVIDISERLHNSFDWSNEYYESKCIAAERLIVKEILEKKEIVDIFKFYEGLKKLLASPTKLKNNDLKSQEISSLLTKVQNVVLSPTGECMREVRGITYSFKEIWENKMFVYVELPVLKKKTSIGTLGKMFIGDMCFAIGEKFESLTIENAKDLEWFNVFIDELGSFLIDTFIEVYNKCLGAKVKLFTAYQSRNDISKFDPYLLSQMEVSTHETFIFNNSSNDEANEFSGSAGSVHTEKKTYQISNDEIQEKGSVRETREFLAHPDIFKSLEQGQCVRKSVFPKVVELLNVNFLDPDEVKDCFKNSPILKVDTEEGRVENILPSLEVELLINSKDVFKKRFKSIKRNKIHVLGGISE